MLATSAVNYPSNIRGKLRICILLFYILCIHRLSRKEKNQSLRNVLSNSYMILDIELWKRQGLPLSLGNNWERRKAEHESMIIPISEHRR